MSVRYTRNFRYGDTGTDVEGVGRALTRAGIKGNTPYRAFTLLPQRIRRKWGDRKRDDLRRFQRAKKLPVAPGYTKETHAKLAPYFDARARKLMEQYVPPPPPIPLVQPVQGWNSLAKYLWTGYSKGRGMGLTDEGTYNPASKLPSGARSDHAYYPARAYDLGVPAGKDAIGWQYFNWAVGKPWCHYVIYRTRIWSTESGMHTYTYGGHESHVHTSGKWNYVQRLRQWLL